MFRKYHLCLCKRDERERERDHWEVPSHFAVTEMCLRNHYTFEWDFMRRADESYCHQDQVSSGQRASLTDIVECLVADNNNSSKNKQVR